MRLLRETGAGIARRLDASGLVAAATAIILLLVGLAEGGSHGFGTLGALVPLATAALLTVLFVRRTLRRDSPLVDLRILASPGFSRAMVVMVLLTVAQFGRFVYIPLELGTTRNISALTIGLVMLPQAVGMAVTMPIGGRLADSIGSRVPTVIGTAVFAASIWPIAHLSPTTSLEEIAFWLFIAGLGTGLAVTPPNVVAMNAVPALKVSQATALSQVTRQLAAAVGTAGLAAVFAGIRPTGDVRSPHNVVAVVDAYNTIFLVIIGVLVVTCLLSLRLPGRRQALEFQAERRRERALLSDLDALELGPERHLVPEVA